MFVNYDDSDGWYDHVYSGVTNPSPSIADNLTSTVTGKITTTHPTSGKCGSPQARPLAGQQGRCGFGPRLPMIAISPCAASDAVDHNLSDQASIINFIEYNWNLPGIPGSFDQALKSTDATEGIPFDLAGMFDFSNCDQPALPLDPTTGQIDLHGVDLRRRPAGSRLRERRPLRTRASTMRTSQGAFLPGTNLRARTCDRRSATLAGADLTGREPHESPT